LQERKYEDLEKNLIDRYISVENLEDSNFWIFLGMMEDQVFANSIKDLAKSYFSSEKSNSIDELVKSVMIDVDEGKTQPSEKTQSLFSTIFGYSTRIISAITYPITMPFISLQRFCKKTACSVYEKLFGHQENLREVTSMTMSVTTIYDFNFKVSCNF